MKKLLLLSTLFLAANLSAEEIETAETLKQKSLKACQAKAASLSEEEKASALAVCQCVSEKADYELILEAKRTGERDRAKQHIKETVQACKVDNSIQ